MIKTVITTNSGRKDCEASENETVEKVLERMGIVYNNSLLRANGAPVDDVKKTLGELNLGNEVRLTCIVKTSNAVSVEVNGDIAIITSELPLESYKLIKKYRPKELSLRDEDDKEYFRVDVAAEGAINKFGAEFGERANNEGKAIITVGISPEVEDVKQALLDAIGCSLANINKLEEKLPEIAAEIKKENDKIINSITVK